MASYYDDAYDPRLRSSRREAPSIGSRDEYYLKPATGANEAMRSGESVRGQNRSYGSQRSPNRCEYASRDTYPPPLPPATGRPPRRSASVNRKRSSWPPLPTCEDEATSLAKEAGAQKQLRDIGKDPAESRGTINQEPIIQDVPEFINRDERRFVLGNRDASNTNPPTPPTSEDEKARKTNRRPSKLNTNFNKVQNSVPELGKRPASPYAFKPSTQAQEEQTFDRFQSPDSLLSPPPTDSRSGQRANVGTRSQPSSPGRDSARYGPSSRTTKDYFSPHTSECAVDDAVNDPDKSATYSRSRDAPRFSQHTSVVDFASQPSAVPIRKLNLDARRNTDTASTLPTLPKSGADNARRPTPLTATNTISGVDNAAVCFSPTTTQLAADYPLPRSRETTYVSSRAISPADSALGPSETAATARSPRVSAEFTQDRSAGSSPTSRTGSVPSSRPSSPSPQTPGDSPRLPRTDLDWSTLLAANAARRSKPPSRLSASLEPESMPAASYTSTKQRSPRTDSLPYPVDDGPATPTVWMPSERTHQYFPRTRPSLQVPMSQESKTLSRTASPAPSNSSFMPTGSSRPVRPSFQPRNSTPELPQTEIRQQTERRKAEDSRRMSFNTSSQAKKDIQALARKSLPACPRDTPVSGYDDWYTLIGAPSLDFCPSCLGSMFERTVFRNYFRRSPPRNYDAEVCCALGGMPWIRLAWLLTLQQQRTDLLLLKDLADIEETSRDPCPGNREAVRSWYGLRDSDGVFVKNFHVCYSDVKRVERLLPTLSGFFVPLPRPTTEEKHLCAIRPQGNRFSAYLDTLALMHERALDYRRQPDPSPFIQLVKQRQSLRECRRDDFFINGLWHYIPSLPELTVCEDCYESVVAPEARKDNDIAMRFNRTLQPAYGEGIGSSCQIYSRRMRKVLQRAMEDRDMNYLARKVKERREAEVRLQERYRFVLREAERLAWDGSSREEVEYWVNRESGRITAVWKSEWE